MVQKTYGTGETDREMIPDGLCDYNEDNEDTAKALF